jgi:ABC-2 type transport system permease protein
VDRAHGWYNPELRTAVFVVPGIIGVILTMTMVMLTSMAIARERERGTLEALIVSRRARNEADDRQARCPTCRRLRAGHA